MYLVRHAEPQSAVDQVYADTGLSVRGRAQARALAEQLGDVRLRGVLASPLARARETAEILVEGRGLSVEIDAAFAEGSLGALQGLDRALARARFPEHFRLGGTVMARLAASAETAPGGESRAAFQARARAAAARLRSELDKADAAPLLVVAHGGLLNLALQYLLGVPPSDAVPFGFDFCGVLRLAHYAEEPAFGPFPMLCFAGPGGDFRLLP